mgnify:CR=1 FL=1
MNYTMKLSKKLSFGEEIANSVTHAVGALLMLILLPISAVYSFEQHGLLSAFGTSIFVISLFLMFLSSTVYHAMSYDSPQKYVLRIIDHSMIYIAIAGSYTPVVLTLMNNWMGYSIILIQWGTTIFGILYKIFAKKVNEHFHANASPSQDIQYVMNYDIDSLLHIDTLVRNKVRGGSVGSINLLSEGLRSIYALSFLEAYIEEEDTLSCIIMIEDPEIYLHPQLQKVASEILYRLSKKNQVLFTTHSPNLIFNFSTKQIREIILDEEYYTIARQDTDIDVILDDLGYTANDLMNVSFVFIVEGKQDSNRLPLLLEKYYSEIYDDDGKLQRITIIPTNSCTNIKTYANLKYINKLYLKDQFLMIRDSDGKNPKYLKKQLCNYYSQRAKEDLGNLPKIEPKNVLILKYYSFENYFLEPSVMKKIGVIRSEEDFYNILYKKYKDYLFKLNSFKKLLRTKNFRIKNKQDIKDHIEDIKIYVRGHNLFDIFYGRYHGTAEQEILKKYIDAAPRETFQDIFDAIDSFVYFENRKK